MAGFTAAIGLGLSVFGAIQGRQEAKKQERLAERSAAVQREQADLERRRADIANARTMRASIRQARIAQAQAANLAGSSGLLGSSAFQGGMAASQTQQGANVGFFGQQQQFSEASFQNSVEMADISGEQGRSQARATQAGLISGFGRQVLNDAGGYQAIAKTGRRLFGL